METFCMSLREIEERFTKSELVLMGWRSHERSTHFRRKMKKARRQDHVNWDQEEQQEAGFTVSESGKKRKIYEDGIGPEGMPDEFFNDEGDFDLSIVRGKEAVRYFEQVLRLPMPNIKTEGVARDHGPEDEVSRMVREAYIKPPGR